MEVWGSHLGSPLYDNDHMSCVCGGRTKGGGIPFMKYKKALVLLLIGDSPNP